MDIIAPSDPQHFASFAPRNEVTTFSGWLLDPRSPRCLVVQADPGLGKTILLNQLLGQIRPKARTARGRAERSQAGADPFIPFRDVVVELISDDGHPKSVDDIVRGLGESAFELIPDLAGLVYPALGVAIKAGQVGYRRLGKSSEAARKARSEFTQSLENVITTLAGNRPLVVAIDDFHWADEASTDLLHYLVRRVQAPTFKVALFTRPTSFQQPNVRDWLMDMSFHNTTQVVPLPAFREGDLKELLRRRWHSDDFHPSIPELLFHLTGGVPLVVDQYIRYLEDTGVIIQRGTSFLLDRSALPKELPPGISSLLTARLQLLDSSELSLLQAAAVVGDTFDISSVASALNVDFDEAGLALGALSRKTGLVRPTTETGDAYAFHHALLHETVYTQLSSTERRVYHSRVAEHLVRLPDASLGSVGHHLRAAGRRDEALPYAVAAAQQDLTVSAYQSASERLEGLVPSEGGPDSDDYFSTLLAAQIGSGHATQASVTLSTWKSMSGGLSAQGIALDAELAHLLGDYTAARTTVQPLIDEQKTAAMIRGLHYLRFTDPAAAEKEADTLLRTLNGEPTELMQLKYVVGANVLFLRNRLADGEVLLREVIDYAECVQNHELAAGVRRRLVDLALFNRAHLHRRGHDEIQANLNEARRHAELSGTRQRLYLLVTHAEVLRHTGRSIASIELTDYAADRFASAGVRLWQAHALLAGAEARRVSGATFDRQLEQARDLYCQLGLIWGEIHCAIVAAAARGDIEHHIEKLTQQALSAGLITEAEWLSRGTVSVTAHPIMYI